MKGIIVSALFVIAVVCCTDGAPVETEVAASASTAKQPQISPATTVFANPSASAKSSISDHPRHKRRRHHRRRHKLHRHRHKLYPLKDRLQKFVGGSSETASNLLASVKNPRQDFEMTNGEVFEHGGVPDLSATLLNQIWPKDGVFAKAGSKRVLSSEELLRSLRKLRSTAELHDMVTPASAALHGVHLITLTKSSTPRDRTNHLSTNSTELHHLFEDNGSSDDLLDDIDESEFANSSIDDNTKLMVNLLPNDDYTNEVIMREATGSDFSNDTKSVNATSTDLLNDLLNSTNLINISDISSNMTVQKFADSVIGDEDDTLIENTEVLQIPTHPKEFGKEQSKIVLDKSPAVGVNVTDIETLKKNSTQNSNSSVSTATFVDEIISNYSSKNDDQPAKGLEEKSQNDMEEKTFKVSDESPSKVADESAKTHEKGDDKPMEGNDEKTFKVSDDNSTKGNETDEKSSQKNKDKSLEENVKSTKGNETDEKSSQENKDKSLEEDVPLKANNTKSIKVNSEKSSKENDEASQKAKSEDKSLQEDAPSKANNTNSIKENSDRSSKANDVASQKAKNEKSFKASNGKSMKANDNKTTNKKLSKLNREKSEKTKSEKKPMKNNLESSMKHGEEKSRKETNDKSLKAREDAAKPTQETEEKSSKTENGKPAAPKDEKPMPQEEKYNNEKNSSSNTTSLGKTSSDLKEVDSSLSSEVRPAEAKNTSTPRLSEKEKVYNDLHTFIEKLVNFDKQHKQLEGLNDSLNAAKSDQRNINDRNITFDKLHSFVENLVFLDKSIYLVEHIGENNTAKTRALNESQKSAKPDSKHQIAVNNLKNIPSLRGKSISKTLRGKSTKKGRYMDIVFSDNSRQSMDSSNGVNVEALNKLHSNMDSLVSNCLGFDSGNRKSGLELYDSNGNGRIRVRTPTGDLMLSCRGTNGVMKKNTSEILAEDLPEKNKNINFRKLAPNEIQQEKMGNVFLTKRNGKIAHNKRNQTTVEYGDTSSVNEKMDSKSQNTSKKNRLKTTSTRPQIQNKWKTRKYKYFTANKMKSKTRLTKSLQDTLGFLSQFDTHHDLHRHPHAIFARKSCHSADSRSLPQCRKHNKNLDEVLQADQATHIMSLDNGNIESNNVPGSLDRTLGSRMLAGLPHTEDVSIPEPDVKTILDNQIPELNDRNREFYPFDEESENLLGNDYQHINDEYDDTVRLLQDYNRIPYNLKYPELGEGPVNEDTESRINGVSLGPDEAREEERRVVPNHWYNGKSSMQRNGAYDAVVKVRTHLGPMFVTRRVNDLNNNQIHLYTGPPVHFFKPEHDQNMKMKQRLD